MTPPFPVESLLACVLIQYGFLIVWFLAFVFAHDALYRLHARWFRISREQFDAIHYLGMAICKVLVLVFFLALLLATCLPRRLQRQRRVESMRSTLAASRG